jgi:hypothetical protein
MKQAPKLYVTQYDSTLNAVYSDRPIIDNTTDWDK